MPDLGWDAVLVLLRLRVSQSNFHISKHANQRMSERNISKADVTHCLMSGEIVESQNHGWDTKYLIKGNRQDGTPFYLVMALSEEGPYLVTVCEINEDGWEGVRGRMRRKN